MICRYSDSPEWREERRRRNDAAPDPMVVVDWTTIGRGLTPLLGNDSESDGPPGLYSPSASDDESQPGWSAFDAWPTTPGVNGPNLSISQYFRDLFESVRQIGIAQSTPESEVQAVRTAADNNQPFSMTSDASAAYTQWAPQESDTGAAFSWEPRSFSFLGHTVEQIQAEDNSAITRIVSRGITS